MKPFMSKLLKAILNDPEAGKLLGPALRKASDGEITKLQYSGKTYKVLIKDEVTE